MNDVNRILNLEQYTPNLRLSLPEEEKAALLEVQQRALQEMAVAGGLFGSLPVGTGKTLIGLLAPKVLAAARPLLLIEANYRPALEAEVKKWSKTFKLPKIEVVSYELLSQPQSRRLLFSLEPDLIIADEGHNLKNTKSVRFKRVVEYMAERPSTKFVVMSGTMTSRSIIEFAHLMELALRDNAPIPLDPILLGRWARTIDPWSAQLAMDPPRPADWAAVTPLVEWFAKMHNLNGEEVIKEWRKQKDADRREDARIALHERMKRTPGVVLETTGSFDGALNIYLLDIPVPDSVKEAQSEVSTASVLDMHRHLSTLSQGFYYEWDWPNGVPDMNWLLTRKRYAAVLEQVMEEDPDADSPALARQAIDEDEAYAEFRPICEAWDLIKDRAPPTKTVWVNKFLIEDAVTRARQLERCIIWYSHTAVREALEEAGIKTYGEGDGMPEGDLIGLSIHVYGTGWNLQAWSKNIVLHVPGNGRLLEQLLGRLHRRGQTADSVETFVYQHAETLKGFWEQAVRDTRYIAETQGTPTKLSVATVIKLNKEN